MYWLFFINVWGFFLCFSDKRKAIKHQFRVPENVFYLVSLGGGIIGIMIGMVAFHHKVSKPQFIFNILLYFIVHILIVFYLAR